MATATSDQYKKIYEWLKLQFQDEPVPAFEINTETLDYLTRLAETCTAAEKQAAVQLEDLERKTAEYDAEAKRMKRILESAHLDLPSLLEETRNVARDLAESSAALNSKDTSLPNMLLSLTKLQEDRFQAQGDLQVEKEEVSGIIKKNAKAMKRVNQLNKFLEEAQKEAGQQESEDLKNKRKLEFIESKSHEYKKKIHQLQKSLNIARGDKSVSHDQLLKLHQEFLEVEEKLAPLERKLQSYCDLPPDCDLVKVKIEEAKMELQCLEKKITDNISGMQS